MNKNTVLWGKTVLCSVFITFCITMLIYLHNNYVAVNVAAKYLCFYDLLASNLLDVGYPLFVFAFFAKKVMACLKKTENEDMWIVRVAIPRDGTKAYLVRFIKVVCVALASYGMFLGLMIILVVIR